MPERIQYDSLKHSELDGLRGIAVLLVLFWHLIYGPAITSNQLPDYFSIIKAIPLLSLGWTGVDLFFILSGYLIGSSLLRYKGRKNGAINFAVRRVFRIMPLYLCLLGMYFVLHKLDVLHEKNGITAWLLGSVQVPAGYFLVLANNIYLSSINSFGPAWLGVTWSLAVEFQFYIIIAFVVLLAPSRILPAIFIIIFTLAIAYRISIVFNGNALGAYVLTIGRLDALFMGALLALIPAHKTGFQLGGKLTKVVSVTVVACFIVTCVIHYHDPRVFAPSMQILGYTVIGLFYMGMFALTHFTGGKGLIYRLATLKSLRWLGEVSYPVYLFHMPVYGLTYYVLGYSSPAATGLSYLPVSALIIAVTLTLSASVHRCIEKPSIKFSKLIIDRMQNRLRIVE